MRKFGQRRTRGLAIALLAFMSLPALSDSAASTANDVPAIKNSQALSPRLLYPEPRYENIAELVAQFIQKSHYKHFAVDDELSSKVLDSYIESLCKASQEPLR